MDKISLIIPPSTRRVWNTGEVPKPKRVSEPVADDGGRKFAETRGKSPRSPEAGIHVSDHFGPIKGPPGKGRIDTLA